MKKFFLSIILLVGMISFSQQHRFETTGFSTLSKDKKGKWGKWSTTKPSKMIITADEDKFRFVVYSERIQLFEILKFEEPKSDKKESTNAYICKDDSGVDCTITIVTQKESKTKQFYIAYNDYIIQYDIVYLKDKK